MEESILDSVTEASGGGIPNEYSDDEIHQQTTDFLLYFIDQMKELTDDQKARMRAKVIDRALNPQQLMEEVMKPKKVTEPLSPQDFIVLVSLILLIAGILGKKSPQTFSSKLLALF